MKKEYISPRVRTIEIESDSILASSNNFLDEEEDTQEVGINTQEVLDTNSPNFVVW